MTLRMVDKERMLQHSNEICQVKVYVTNASETVTMLLTSQCNAYHCTATLHLY
jgi:hypothetical protein